MLKNRIQCIKIQVFLSYVLVLSLSFAVLGFGVAMAARQIMTNQIGSSRIDLLRQISERTNTVKTSATTLVGLYRYGIADLTEIPENMDELLQADKRRYSGVFGPIGMDNDPLLVTGQGIYSSFPEQELPLIWNPSCGTGGCAGRCWMHPPGRWCSAAPSQRPTARAISSPWHRPWSSLTGSASLWC